MLEGLPPNNASHVMRLSCEEGAARRIADLMVETFDPAEVAASAFEDDPMSERRPVTWTVEVYFQDAPDEETIRALVEVAADAESARRVVFASISQRDWVASSLEGLKPVKAGRFLVHGAHDRGKAAANKIALQIEAALAFGTGHHGTTLGCLLLLDKILSRRRPRHILDVGTGTGVLAMAAAKALRAPVSSGDIDPVATAAAHENARLNGVAPLVRPVVARDVQHPALANGAPYDLIFANILAGPLRKMAPRLAAVAAPDAELVLSGLMGRDHLGVQSAYAAQNFYLVERLERDGWTSLLLRRGGASRRPLSIEVRNPEF